MLCILMPRPVRGHFLMRCTSASKHCCLASGKQVLSTVGNAVEAMSPDSFYC